jgi:hypothetical protein
MRLGVKKRVSNAQVFESFAQVPTAKREKIGTNSQKVAGNARLLSRNCKKRIVLEHVFGTPLRKCADVATVPGDP